jgi:Tol biopolymer transport system component
MKDSFTFVAVLVMSCAVVYFIQPETASATDSFAPSVQQAATPTPTPVNNGGLPSVSPDGSHMAFVSNRGGVADLFVISADGTDEVQLTHTPETESLSGWTSHSKGIVFSVFANDTSRLYTIGLDGKNQREIANVPGRGPMLSPDGKRIVFMAGTWTATRLMVSALDGSNAKQINDGSSIAWNNHWSPDGKRIAFTGRNDPKGELAVFVMNADGSERRQLSHIAPEEGGAQWPVWSPNGRQLAIQVNNRKQKNFAHIWIVDVATGEARKLAAHDQPYLDETPSWFPDGKRLALQSNRTGKMEVWVMNADGSGQRQVTGTQQSTQRVERHASLPVATGDGKRIFFSSDRDGRPQIYSMNLDGTDERRLSDLSAFDMAPDSSSDGEVILFLFFPSEDAPTEIALMRADGSGRRTVTAVKDPRWPRISPNGKRIAFTAKDDNGASTIFTMNVDGSDLRRFPSGLSQAWDPAWSPDGNLIAFGAYPADFKDLKALTSTIYLAETSGRNRRQLATVPGLLQLPRWSADGTRLAFQTYTGGRDANIIVIDIASGKIETVTHHERPYMDETPSWLPDGRLLFQSNRTGMIEVWIMNADGSDQRPVTGVKPPRQ